MTRLLTLAVILILVGCSSGKQTITLSVSAWGLEFAPSIESENVSFFTSPVVVTNMNCECHKETLRHD